MFERNGGFIEASSAELHHRGRVRMRLAAPGRATGIGLAGISLAFILATQPPEDRPPVVSIDGETGAGTGRHGSAVRHKCTISP